jgi:nucleotide-binding universal stress UspA family protein
MGLSALHSANIIVGAWQPGDSLMIKKILVPMGGVSERSRHLEAALGLSVRFGAHVDALHTALDPRDSVAYLGDGMTGTMISQVMAAAEKESQERAIQAQEVFRESCEKLNIAVTGNPMPNTDVKPSASFDSIAGHQDVLVAHHGRLSDLIVGGRSVNDTTSVLPVALEAAIMETGRPVLVVPPVEIAWDALASIGKKIAIAWAGSPEASRAVAFSIPFLQEAEQVSIIFYGGEHGEGAGASELQEYLAWHGIAASVAVEEGQSLEKASIGASLLKRAEKLDIDLLVMGAFTHSRLRQIIFGGITRHILENAQIPLLLAH